jgi:hypothetical protein
MLHAPIVSAIAGDIMSAPDTPVHRWRVPYVLGESRVRVSPRPYRGVGTVRFSCSCAWASSSSASTIVVCRLLPPAHRPASHTHVTILVHHTYINKTTRAIHTTIGLYVHVRFLNFTIIPHLRRGIGTSLRSFFCSWLESFARGAPEQKVLSRCATIQLKLTRSKL